MSQKRLIVLVLSILAVAGSSRFWALDHIPPGIYPDEAINGNEGIEAVRTGKFKVFYPTNNGREGLWINIVGVSIFLFGSNPLGLRFCSALFGTLTVLFLYLLAKELFSRRVALLSSFLLATSFWHLNFSRIAFSAILVPFLMTCSLYLLFRAWRISPERSAGRGTWAFAAFGGALYGLGFHTYIPYRFTPLVVLVLLGVEYLRRSRVGEDVRSWLAKTFLWLLAAFLVAVPIGVYFLRHPEDFFARAADVSIFSAEHPVKEFGTVLLKTAGMFNIRGDCNWRHNLACSPELLLPVGIVFLFGLALAITEVFHQGVVAVGYCLLVVWFAILLLPELLTFEGIPHALRAIGVIPPTSLLAGIGADAIFEKLKHKKIAVCVFLAVLLSTGPIEFYRYFGIWARSPDTAQEFMKQLVDIGKYFNGLASSTPRFLIVNELAEPAERVPHVNPDGAEKLIPMPAQTVAFVTQGHPRAIYLLPEEIAQANLPRGSIIVLMEPDEKVLEELKNRGCEVEKPGSADFMACVIQGK